MCLCLLAPTDILQPGMVLSKGGSFADWIRRLAPSVKVDVLARTTVDVAVGNDSRERVLDNEVIRVGVGSEWPIYLSI